MALQELKDLLLKDPDWLDTATTSGMSLRWDPFVQPMDWTRGNLYDSDTQIWLGRSTEQGTLIKLIYRDPNDPEDID